MERQESQSNLSIHYLAWSSLSRGGGRGDMLTIKPAYGNQKG
nr:MAG TPA: hypothetical protein [Caudoviricetes sp.]DAX86636.1 MAG TPA: hypothetical protein [Caudoviricetes sp.]